MISAVLKAARDHLRSELVLNDNECRIMTDGRPAPSCGQKFISVVATYWGPHEDDNNRSLYERYDISCVLTMRTPLIPFDRLGENLIYEDSPFAVVYDSMEELTRRVMVALHQNPTVITNANYLIPDDEAGISEYLRWAGCDATPEFVDGSWFGSNATQISGLVQTIRFQGATRMQSLHDSSTVVR